MLYVSISPPLHRVRAVDNPVRSATCPHRLPTRALKSAVIDSLSSLADMDLKTAFMRDQSAISSNGQSGRDNR
jgi:hypothetical protein